MDIVPVEQGDILAGKYRVERVLGVGGMGVVVAATHIELLELRALKFMLPNALNDAEATERFVREARAAARLKSEHVAKVHDVGRLENGAPYMVMEYLEGDALDAVLRQWGPLPPEVAALYAIQVCKALAEAHALGIVHRDIKPSNLFLTRRPDGTDCVKVLDFGISKMVGVGPEFEMTKTSAVMGSPYYMAPEQMRSARTVDARADIWSLGVILYRLITGRLPFVGQNATELIAKVLETEAPPPSSVRPDLPPALEAVILRCLRRSRDERFANVAELAAALAPFSPYFADAPVESMSRILALPVPVAAMGPVPSVERTPASTSASMPTGIARPGEHTGGAWGNTASGLGSRVKLSLVVLAGAVAILVVAFGVFWLRSSSEVPRQEDQAASVAASVEAPPSALPVEPSAAASPASSASPPEAVVEPSAVASSEPTVAPIVRSVASSPRVAPGVAKPPATSRPSASAKPGGDPFGKGRK